MMKKMLKILLIMTVAGLLAVTPTYAMEGTDGTVDTPTNRVNVEEHLNPDDFELDHDEIETGEGYQNIVPINDDIMPINSETTENDRYGIHPLVYVSVGIGVVFIVGALYLIRMKGN